jgi:hypothetical protein
MMDGKMNALVKNVKKMYVSRDVLSAIGPVATDAIMMQRL